MKTSVIEVRDMLSVLSVDSVEQRVAEVPGVESVTVNYAARNATVRFDETHIEVGDIKAAVRQNGYESDGEASHERLSEPKASHENAARPTQQSGSAPKAATAAPKPAAEGSPVAPTPSPSVPLNAAKPAPDANPAAPADDAKPDEVAQKAGSPSPMAA